MSEAPEVKIVLCPFNRGLGCMTTACRLYDETNSMCIFETMINVQLHTLDAIRALEPTKPSRKRPPKVEEPPKE